MPVSREQTLFVILGVRPSISIQVTETKGQIELNGVRYALVEREVGFYDFLRNRESKIIGLRFSFFSKPRVLKDAAELDYIYVNEKRHYIEMYLQGYRGSVIEALGEQAFGDDAIWLSDLGTYALEVGTAELTDVEIDGLKEYVLSSG